MKSMNRISSRPLCFREGDRISAVHQVDSHFYRQGVSYVVIETDHNDQTLMAQDETGRVGKWIPWAYCTSVNHDRAA